MEGKLPPIVADCMATVQDVLDELKSAGKEHRWYKLYYSGERPLGNTDTLADLGLGLEVTLNYQRGASWKPTEREMREAIDSYDEMEIYHPGGDRDIRYWDTSDMINMSELFRSKNRFNADISRWDTSKVTSMGCMFMNARKFNADIKNWDTSNVTNMRGMFSHDAQSFN